MGGYGALHLAFRHPQLFSAVSAHSPAIIDKLPALHRADFGRRGAFTRTRWNLRFAARSCFLGPQQPAHACANYKSFWFENLF